MLRYLIRMHLFFMETGLLFRVPQGLRRTVKSYWSFMRWSVRDYRAGRWV